ncbi:hypothetical protein [Streptomyces sp. AV19]|nr:hypothetical protein [Streptomyces sp. AV19]MDG4533419.1 hypothetical protein [Streptomyces sp. AV19]
MSALPRCRVCGWHRSFRNKHAARRAVRTHTCFPRRADGGIR